MKPARVEPNFQADQKPASVKVHLNQGTKVGKNENTSSE